MFVPFGQFKFVPTGIVGVCRIKARATIDHGFVTAAAAMMKMATS
jgi:hypothetical protein